MFSPAEGVARTTQDHWKPLDALGLSVDNSCLTIYIRELYFICTRISDILSRVWGTECRFQGRGWQPLWDKILMSTGTSCHFIHLLQVSKKCLWSLILYNFLHDLMHIYSPRAGTGSPQGTKFWCQQKALSLYPFVASFKEISILYIFFHDLIHVYSPGAGAYSPQGTKFWCQQKLLVTSVICCQFQIT